VGGLGWEQAPLITSVTSATEAATAVASGVSVALGLGGAVLLILLFVIRDLLAGSDSPHRSALEPVVRVAMWPLAIVFTMSISVQTIAIVAGALP
jgi:hypothetical protein